MINFLIGAESLDFVISGATKIETSLRTLPQVFLGEFFSCKFFSFFSPLSKTRLRHRYFLVNFEKLFSLQLYQKRDSGTGLSL